ncbi:MaoC/PaaZ C-terminal domain-containing protein [Anaerobium acetethylicum]|uniref:3-hydroxybutyryl-CoA dehydratase n=1 Tax=Anaerobium acetethylicum TaxID=1619234 RepID=A0A1D3TS98_9FIRM|nr:MaoC/PaaZ C-terminal domain-containing protein [Anaerobium acetethylicum]SCP96712.1 3-hydroxybutyryl-CoA dehydratase [Anaerobium acetethylicum]
MNAFSYDEILIGHAYEFTADIRDEEQNMFCRLSGDVNPLHRDREFAVGRGFKDRVVYGMLTASYYSTLVGVFLPGERCLIHEMELKFTKPVYINDTLTIRGEVTEKNDTFQLLTIKATIRNQLGLTVSKAKIRVSV